MMDERKEAGRLSKHLGSQCGPCFESNEILHVNASWYENDRMVALFGKHFTFTYIFEL